MLHQRQPKTAEGDGQSGQPHQSQAQPLGISTGGLMSRSPFVPAWERVGGLVSGLVMFI